MELHIKKLRVQEERNQVLGGWHTQLSLEALGWSERLGRRRRSIQRATEEYGDEHKELGKGSRLSENQ